jgi:hypothetical protein
MFEDYISLKSGSIKEILKIFKKLNTEDTKKSMKDHVEEYCKYLVQQINSNLIECKEEEEKEMLIKQRTYLNLVKIDGPYCIACQKSIEKGSLSKCSHCKVVSYCSVDCQRKDYEFHIKIFQQILNYIKVKKDNNLII